MFNFKQIIHNYGHGGNGIALSRGTAVHAVELLLAEIADSKFRIATDKPKSNL
jgi:glycine/D-amino acid oxidase-like deaminating enzyme